LREKPVLPVRATPQIAQDYFALLPFKPAEFLRWRVGNVVCRPILGGLHHQYGRI
jgi:hypothetical protein